MNCISFQYFREGFAASLAQRRAEGHRSARHPLPELQERGYADSKTHLKRLLGQWRRADHAGCSELPAVADAHFSAAPNRD